MLFMPDPGHRNPVIDLRDGEKYVVSGSNRFCYHNSIAPTWKQTWTRIVVGARERTFYPQRACRRREMKVRDSVFEQVKVCSSEVFKVVVVDGEEQLQELEGFSLWGWVQSMLHERHNETIINIDLFSKKTCFKIEPARNSQYTVLSVRSR